MARVSSYVSTARRRGNSAERGQMLIIFALIIVPITFALGAVAVDASVWQSERRGAQKDADLAALAGALELVPNTQDQSAAEDAAIDYGDANDESGNADTITVAGAAGEAETVFVDNSCFGTGRLDSVSVNLDHKSRTFFAEAFGLSIAPNIGAHARACVGSLTNPRGLRPFAIDIATSSCFVQPTQVPPPDPGDIGQPNFGEVCTMDFGAQGGPGGANRGLIDLEEVSGSACSVNGGGSADLLANIKFGADANCFTDSDGNCAAPYVDCVLGQSGNVASKVPEGIRYLLNQGIDCDGADANNYDDFAEALELFGGGTAPPDPDNLYSPVICKDGKESERIITIVAIDAWPFPSNPPIPVRYFVPMYIVGCENPDTGVLYPMCPAQAEGAQGHIRLKGIIFQAFLSAQGEAGAPNESGTKVIVLDE